MLIRCWASSPEHPTIVRIMAANLTSGNGQDYDPGHGNRMIQALKPDIVLVQEMSYLSNSPSDLRAWIDATFGAGFHYYREPAAGIPNGIVSRFPILAAGEWDDPVLENREFAWARIDIPGRRDLWAVSVHFKASSNCAPQRREQARELVKQLTSAIPAQDYVVLGGDLNTSERAESCIRTLASYFVTSGPYPADTHGNSETNAGRDKPYDWVLADQELETKRVPLILGSLQFPNGLVFDTRTYDPLTELPPAERTDSGAANMQHMAVLRAFAFPAQD